MGKRTEIIILVVVLSIVITITGSVFENIKGVGQSLTKVAAARKQIQNSGNTVVGNNLQQPSSAVTQQSSSDTNQTSFKNIVSPGLDNESYKEVTVS